MGDVLEPSYASRRRGLGLQEDGKDVHKLLAWISEVRVIIQCACQTCLGKNVSCYWKFCLLSKKPCNSQGASPVLLHMVNLKLIYHIIPVSFPLRLLFFFLPLKFFSLPWQVSSCLRFITNSVTSNWSSTCKPRATDPSHPIHQKLYNTERRSTRQGELAQRSLFLSIALEAQHHRHRVSR